MATYFCAGFGYVVTATFIVAIVNLLPGLEGKGNLVFLVIGLAAAPSCIAWDFIARIIGELNALVICAFFQIIGPAITAQIASSFGSYSAGLYIATGVMFLGSFLFFLLTRMEVVNA